MFSPGQPIKMTRQELYEKVWDRPVTTVAREIGLSGTALAKACRRKKVPLPPLGYWAKVRHGKKVKRPSLPDLQEGESEEIEFWVQQKKRIDEHLDSAAKAKIALEQEAGNRIVVEAHYQELHPLVKRTQESLKTATIDDTGTVQARTKRTLNVKVHPKNIDRATRIWEAVIRALECRGIQVDVRPPKKEEEGKWLTIATVMGEDLNISLEEVLEKKDETPRPRPYAWRPEWIPSGRLSMRIDETFARGFRRTWADTNLERLEERLNRFVIGLYRMATAKRVRRLESERRRREREQEERKVEERYQRALKGWEDREAERERVVALLSDADNWAKSQRIRAYIQAVKAAAEKGPLEAGPEEDLPEWLRWAEQAADQFDPLIAKEVYDETKRDDKPEEYDFEESQPRLPLI